MVVRKPGFFGDPATKVVVKVAVYYAALIILGSLALRYLPHSPGLGGVVLPSILRDAAGTAAEAKSVAVPTQGPTATLVSVAMLAAILLMIPVAWVYQLTRAKRGYQQSVVQLLIILPLVVAGIVVLIKYSLALAFGMAAIVAAVRFRNTLDDSKDAVYVFLATAIGLSAAVDIPVAAAISVLFNLTMVTLWYTDFGNSPIELEGRIAARRLRRVKELARTGTFVAQIDNEVLRNMSREQLEGLAQRALRRAQDDGSREGAVPPMETCLRVRTRDMNGTRRNFEMVMGEFAKQWRAGEPVTDAEGIHTIDYYIQPKKNIQPDEIMALVRTTAGAALVDAHIR